MVHFHLPFSWHIILVCCMTQAVCLGMLGYCGYQFFVSQQLVVVAQPNIAVSVAGRGNPYGLTYLYARMSNCQVFSSTDGITLYGRADAIMYFACRCWLAGISFSRYSLHPRGIGPYFRLWVVV